MLSSRRMTTKEHPAKHDREVAEIRALIRQGWLMIAGIRRLQCSTRKDLQLLVEALRAARAQ